MQNQYMQEIELKARVVDPLEIEQTLTRFADFSSHYSKKDTYWTINDKTIRVREQQNLLANTQTVLVTQKVKKICNAIEVNSELEFELEYTALPVFTAMLKNTGFVCTAKKGKNTKVFIPRFSYFETSLLTDAHQFSIELSYIENLGWFIEIELLYPENASNKDAENTAVIQTAENTAYFGKAQKLLHTVLDFLHISYDAIEERPYTVLLAEKSL